MSLRQPPRRADVKVPGWFVVLFVLTTLGSLAALGVLVWAVIALVEWVTRHA